MLSPRSLLAVCAGSSREPRTLSRLRSANWRVELRPPESLRPGVNQAADLPDRAVVFLGLPTAAALEVVRTVRRLPMRRVVVISECGSIAGAVQALRSGAQDYLCEPVQLPELLAALAGRPARRAPAPAPEPSLDRAIWEHLNLVLAEAGTLSEAARRLGVQRRSLRRMLNKTPPPR